MRQPLRYAFIVVVALWLTPAAARNLGTVVFEPAPNDVFNAAFGLGSPVIDPLPASDTVWLNAPSFVPTVMASVSGLPATGATLLASCSDGASQAVTLSGTRQQLCPVSGRRYHRTQVSFQVALSSGTPAGIYNMTVQLDYGWSWWDHEGRWGAGDQVTIRLVVPAVTAIKRDGGDTVAFDYSSDVSAFVSALGGTLPPTSPGTTFQDIRVYSNTGYIVSATASAVNPSVPTVPVSSLRVKGHRLSPSSPVVVASGSSPMTAPEVAVSASDYAIAAEPSALAGSYQYTVHYVVATP